MAKLGTKGKPAIVRVQTQERAMEIMEICNDNDWQVIVGIEPDKDEDITDLNRINLDPTPVFVPKAMPVKNAPCPCGSGKQYKRCCGK